MGRAKQEIVAKAGWNLDQLKARAQDSNIGEAEVVLIMFGITQRSLGGASDHHAVAALDTPDPATDPNIHVMDSLGSEFFARRMSST